MNQQKHQTRSADSLTNPSPASLFELLPSSYCNEFAEMLTDKTQAAGQTASGGSLVVLQKLQIIQTIFIITDS